MINALKTHIVELKNFINGKVIAPNSGVQEERVKYASILSEMERDVSSGYCGVLVIATDAKSASDLQLISGFPQPVFNPSVNSFVFTILGCVISEADGMVTEVRRRMESGFLVEDVLQSIEKSESVVYYFPKGLLGEATNELLAGSLPVRFDLTYKVNVSVDYELIYKRAMAFYESGNLQSAVESLSGIKDVFPKAMFSLSHIFLKHANSNKDTFAGVAMMREAAKNNVPAAHYEMAHICRYGRYGESVSLQHAARHSFLYLEDDPGSEEMYVFFKEVMESLGYPAGAALDRLMTMAKEKSANGDVESGLFFGEMVLHRGYGEGVFGFSKPLARKVLLGLAEGGSSEAAGLLKRKNKKSQK